MTDWKTALLKKNLGALVNKLNISQQRVIAAKAHSLLGCITKCIPSRLRESILPLYSVLVISQLECCSQFCTSLKRNMGILK